ncbi:polyamine deacetylase HDAC10 isoform X4 [Mustela lutreola]|uniref:polyamine deacetylase HDAC10 isoform X4 n=1 Tax=Mustela lutreola TaxID=9666 RepID=UPI0027979C0A|nr:polyamine deacetylase HDAC10 isoform X4 [Mustela lutreola]
MRTALVYHEEMTAARLLWDDPECEIERPERLTAAVERLQQGGLEQRCLQLAAREASEAELGLVHSPEYVSLMRGTQALSTEELQALSGQYDAVYFHPSTFHCARLAAGAALQLVDAVLTGTAHNGLALVRPPGHHSQRAAANGFCVFNNVAIAARYAQKRHGVHRILIVDWDVHHGQGIQYIFEDDPSVLYFSWHRYEHGRFWPYLRESDADAVGLGPGRGFTVNLPWNQGHPLILGPRSEDPRASHPPSKCPALMLNGRRLGWAMRITWPPSCTCCSLWPLSLTLSWCSSQQALTRRLGIPRGRCRPLPSASPTSRSCCKCWPAAGSVLCWSALESIQSVRAAQAPHWTSLWQQERRPSPVSPGGPKCKAAEAQTSAVLSSLLDRLHLCATPPVRTAIALTAPAAAMVLPPDILRQEESAPREETQAWARLHEALTQDTAFTALGKVLHLLNGILDGQVSSGIATTPAAASTLEVVLRQGLSHGAQRVFCVALGQLDRPPDLDNDGRTLWLNIRGKEAAALSTLHVSVPLSGTTGGFLSCILALVLPLAYGFQPDLVLVALGPAHGLQDPQAALLAALLRGPAGGRVLVLVEQESTCQLVGVLARVLHGDPPPSLGPFSVASPDDVQALVHLRGQLEAKWEMLQVAAPSGVP